MGELEGSLWTTQTSFLAPGLGYTTKGETWPAVTLVISCHSRSQKICPIQFSEHWSCWEPFPVETRGPYSTFSTSWPCHWFICWQLWAGAEANTRNSQGFTGGQSCDRDGIQIGVPRWAGTPVPGMGPEGWLDFCQEEVEGQRSKSSAWGDSIVDLKARGVVVKRSAERSAGGLGLEGPGFGLSRVPTVC